ncbi:MAG: DNA topoisomerase I [Candidatus Aenigmatarchaeota archaeon]
MTQLIIAEKPNAAGRIAYALAEGDVEQERTGKAVWYETNVGDKKTYVVPAVGHLYTLEQEGEGWDYPIFDVEWKPTHEVRDGSGWMKNYYKNLKKLANKADSFINACDYDQEGSVIGYNILKFIVGTENAGRMKFSTLTTSDLKDAYEDVSEKLDHGMVESGLARHILDWLWGINLSRALTLSVKSADSFKVLSTGRVQGPALKILTDREKEIQEFKPDDYWVLEALLTSEKGEVKARHGKGKFWEEDEADSARDRAAENSAKVKEVEKNKFKHNQPCPFDLSTLQSEAYSAFNFSPSKTLDLAQSLYESGLISYPRTSSQKLPPKIGYQKILEKLKKQNKYEESARKVLDKDKIYPKQGKKEDKAHPAIYPTGSKPEKVSKDEGKLYDLIVKRYFAVFGDPALRESVQLKFDLSGETFEAKGKRTLKENWFKLYEPYVNRKEQKVPDLEEGEELGIKKVEKLDKQTQPPKRYTQASLVTEMKKRNLGTKATRSQIIDKLYDRGYIDGSSIKVTDIGLAVVDALEEYSPGVLSEEMTRKFEEEMEEIREGKNDKEKVVEEARKKLKEILERIKENEEEIGQGLKEAVIKTKKKKSELGECPECGGTLKIIRTGKSQFVGCTNYPDCENSFPLPQNAKIVPTDKSCEDCGLPTFKVIRKGKKPFTMCPDPDCKSKEDWDS